MCNLYLEDLQCINAASISLVLGESGLMFSQTVRSSLVKRKKRKSKHRHTQEVMVKVAVHNVLLEVSLDLIHWHLEITEPFHNWKEG